MPEGDVDLAATVKRSIVEQLGLNPEQVWTASASPKTSAQTSLEIVQIVIEIEEVFGIEVPNDASESLVTVGGAIYFVASKKA